MKNKLLLIIIISILILSFGGLLIFQNIKSSNSVANTGPSPAPSDMVATAVIEANNKQALILDVRTPEEFEAGHANSAINFDIANLNQGQMPDTNKDTKIYVYCRSGNRSNQAKTILTNNGYKNVVDLGSLQNMKDGGAM